MDRLSRRRVLHSLGLAAGTGVLGGYIGAIAGPPRASMAADATRKGANPSPSPNMHGVDWSYAALDPKAVAGATYELHLEGGCTYGLFSGFMRCLAQIRGEPFRSFPCYMMRYGAGGVAHWGSICGALNGAAAVIGLFELDYRRCEDLITELFSWYEATALPVYQPAESNGLSPCVTNVARSISCHLSVTRWCKASGFKADSPERKARCRLLTADVAQKTAELLNANLKGVCTHAGPSAEATSCLSCHREQRHDTLAKMQCNSCHQRLSEKHPDVTGSTSVQRFRQVIAPHH